MDRGCGFGSAGPGGGCVGVVLRLFSVVALTRFGASWYQNELVHLQRIQRTRTKE